MGLTGAGGCPAPRLGVQGWQAKHAVARCLVEPGADLVGLASSPLPMLHFGARVCFCYLFSLNVVKVLFPGA